MSILIYKIVVAALFTLPLALIVAALMFDKLMRLFYNFHTEEWQRNGSPNGYFWSSYGGYFSNSYPRQRACDKIFWNWFFHTPQWLSQHTGAHKILWQFRLSVIFVALPFGLIIILVGYAFIRDLLS